MRNDYLIHAQDIDDLITEYVDLGERISNLDDDMMFHADDEEYLGTLDRSMTRLLQKRFNVLGELKQMLAQVDFEVSE